MPVRTRRLLRCSRRSFRAVKSSVCRHAKCCSEAATSTASRSRFLLPVSKESNPAPDPEEAARVAKSKRRSDDSLIKKLAVKPGSRARLKDNGASDSHGWDKDDALATFDANRKKLEELQFKLYADGRYG